MIVLRPPPPSEPPQLSFQRRQLLRLDQEVHIGWLADGTQTLDHGRLTFEEQRPGSHSVR
ncbi:hypothetical protein FM125_10730 [Micrococcus lylae]|uniref:Uncharacterized protein n=1 Tax=Micrococcus lylae TaxID=1273 RepID=A0A1R4JUD2_9MICC|nr:hypothetical protein FM125_10730 [Micrococcus lylae]